MRGGPIALIQDGDMINIDIPARRVDVELSDQELSERKKGWRPPKPKVTHGYLAHFAKHATSADKGAYLE
jgi:dihydroxy-acid dehydratase